MCDKHGIWGWCEVVVKARIGSLEGFAHLGNCSYEDAEDFKVGGYYPQMVEEAIAELQAQVDELYSLIHVEPATEARPGAGSWSDREDDPDICGY
jgi:hypothetical protein